MHREYLIDDTVYGETHSVSLEEMRRSLRKIAPLSSRDASEILDGLEDGHPLSELVVPELVEPISNWLEEVNRILESR